MLYIQTEVDGTAVTPATRPLAILSAKTEGYLSIYLSLTVFPACWFLFHMVLHLQHVVNQTAYENE
jgi:hypothetical protein